MKNTRKLIPALAMLLISAVLMSTASFAWFSMNREVTATGMEITAKSDNVWLAIETGDTFHPANTAITATASGDQQLYPVAPAEELTSVNVATAAAWHYAYSKSETVSTANGDYKSFTQDKFGDYVATATFSIGLSSISSAASANNLTLRKVVLPKGTGISVVVVCGEKVINVEEDDGSGAVDPLDANKYVVNLTTNNLLAATVGNADATSATVTVYYYINGEDTNVTTSNIAALEGSVELLFGVDE